MEMCVDNPREGIEDLFATHPRVDARVDALVQLCGRARPGPARRAAIRRAPEELQQQDTQVPQPAAADGPWGPDSSGKPFLPSRPPIDLTTPPPGSPASGSDPAPWGPQGGSRR